MHSILKTLSGKIKCFVNMGPGYLCASPKACQEHEALQTLRCLCFAAGYGATAHLESGGFIGSRPDVSHPDIQFHFLPSQVIDHGRVQSQIEAFQVRVV